MRETAEDISQRIRTSEATERRINSAREIYSVVASRASSLFFSTVDMAKLQPIYQFSLNWFMWNCTQILRIPSDTSDENKRVGMMMGLMTKHLFNKVCCSLFE